MTTETKTIQTLNDTLRRTFMTGRVLLTQGVQALSPDDREAVITKVREFETFGPDNDPHEEHDFGAFDHAGIKFFWKIDYYDPSMERGSEDPTDPAKTRRVLTILRADEW